MCVSPRQSRGYDTSPITRRKSYDRAYRYMHCNARIQAFLQRQINHIVWLCDAICPQLFHTPHFLTLFVLPHPLNLPVSGPLTAILPPPPLLWGPGTTATSSQGSPATKPKVLLWTSEFHFSSHSLAQIHAHTAFVFLSPHSHHPINPVPLWTIPFFLFPLFSVVECLQWPCR